MDKSAASAALASAAQRAAVLLRSLAEPEARVTGTAWTFGETAAHLVLAVRAYTDCAAGRGVGGGLRAAHPGRGAFLFPVRVGKAGGSPLASASGGLPHPGRSGRLFAGELRPGWAVGRDRTGSVPRLGAQALAGVSV